MRPKYPNQFEHKSKRTFSQLKKPCNPHFNVICPVIFSKRFNFLIFRIEFFDKSDWLSFKIRIHILLHTFLCCLIDWYDSACVSHSMRSFSCRNLNCRDFRVLSVIFFVVFFYIIHILLHIYIPTYIFHNVKKMNVMKCFSFF